MDEKKYILEIGNDSISIINTECGMRETIKRDENSVFVERLALLVQKDLIRVQEFTPSWEKASAARKRIRPAAEKEEDKTEE
jgi:hypothetical protein